MKTEHHLELPRKLQVEFAKIVQRHTDAVGGEVDAATMWRIFGNEYLGLANHLELTDHQIADAGRGVYRIEASVRTKAQDHQINGEGNGPIAAFFDALAGIGISVNLLDYYGHTMTPGDDAEAASYVECLVDDTVLWGVGVAPSIVTASLRAVVSAVNRGRRKKKARRRI
jgi:2-isopropylmalate synthase